MEPLLLSPYQKLGQYSSSNENSCETLAINTNKELVKFKKSVIAIFKTVALIKTW